MVQASEIRAQMEVLGSDGAHVGTVDHMEGERIKLARRDSSDGEHHYVPLSAVDHVDSHVHLNTTGAALGLAVAGGATAAGAAAAAGTGAGMAGGGDSPLPPIKNRAVEDATPRRNFYLPWIVGIIGLILLLLLLKSCFDGREETAVTPAADPAAPVAEAPAVAALPVEAVSLPNGTTVNLEPNSLNFTLQRYLASTEATPRTFTFDKLNFDTGSAAIRAEDQANVDALAQILAAYPKAQARIVGYTDARGSGDSNAQLGQQRADAVVAALTAKGVDGARLTTESGGEANPADANATAEGRFENRRTELVVTAK